MVDPLTVGGVGTLAAAGGSGLSLSSLGNILGGAGMAAGGIGGLFRGSGSTPDNSTFYQNWRNDDMAWSREQFQRNEDLAKEFAQNGIRWRVADAKAAGLHPLAAIGSAGASYSPTVTAGGGNYSVDHGRPGRDSDIGSSLALMGQGVSRALGASMTKAERINTAFEVARQTQALEHGDLQNQVLRAQLYKMAYPGSPGMPPSVTPGGTPDLRPGHTSTVDPMGTGYKDPYSGITSLPQKDINIDEVSSPGWASFMYTNRLLPLVHQFTRSKSDQPTRPPDSMLPPGAVDWHFAFPGRWIPTFKRFPSTNRGHMSEPAYQYHGSY